MWPVYFWVICIVPTSLVFGALSPCEEDELFKEIFKDVDLATIALPDSVTNASSSFDPDTGLNSDPGAFWPMDHQPTPQQLLFAGTDTNSHQYAINSNARPFPTDPLPPLSAFMETNIVNSNNPPIHVDPSPSIFTSSNNLTNSSNTMLSQPLDVAQVASTNSWTLSNNFASLNEMMKRLHELVQSQSTSSHSSLKWDSSYAPGKEADFAVFNPAGQQFMINDLFKMLCGVFNLPLKVVDCDASDVLYMEYVYAEHFFPTNKTYYDANNPKIITDHRFPINVDFVSLNLLLEKLEAVNGRCQEGDGLRWPIVISKYPYDHLIGQREDIAVNTLTSLFKSVSYILDRPYREDGHFTQKELYSLLIVGSSHVKQLSQVNPSKRTSSGIGDPGRRVKPNLLTPQNQVVLNSPKAFLFYLLRQFDGHHVPNKETLQQLMFRCMQSIATQLANQTPLYSHPVHLDFYIPEHRRRLMREARVPSLWSNSFAFNTAFFTSVIYGSGHGERLSFLCFWFYALMCYASPMYPRLSKVRYDAVLKTLLIPSRQIEIRHDLTRISSNDLATAVMELSFARFCLLGEPLLDTTFPAISNELVAIVSWISDRAAIYSINWVNATLSPPISLQFYHFLYLSGMKLPVGERFEQTMKCVGDLLSCLRIDFVQNEDADILNKLMLLMWSVAMYTQHPACVNRLAVIEQDSNDHRFHIREVYS